MSLRARLVLTLVALVTVGMLGAGAATYGALASYLNGRVDRQLVEALGPVGRLVGEGDGRGPGGGGREVRDLPGGSVAELRGPDGAVLDRRGVGFSDEPVAGALPADLSGVPVVEAEELRRGPGAGDPAPVRVAGVLGTDGVPYRVVRVATASGNEVVVAVPVTEVRETLRRLLAVEVGVFLVVLGLMAGAAWLLVRRGLDPLERMAGTADAIAAGDLSRRVEEADPRTEVGRLGTALNAMLTEIERAFAARTASEQRMRRFLADASHELRTPLTSIRGYAEMFRRGAADRPEDLALAMRRIESEGARMGGLVEDLLTLARLDEEGAGTDTARPPRRDPVDLALLVRDAAADTRVADPDRPVGVEAVGPVTVAGDEARLRQALANLCGNALRHTPGGTPVTLALAVQGTRARVTVADAGPGVPAADAERVFERFWRADASRTRDSGGNGLGLAIVASVAHAHGGRVSVAQAPGGGAAFTLEIPLSQVPPSLVAGP